MLARGCRPLAWSVAPGLMGVGAPPPSLQSAALCRRFASYKAKKVKIGSLILFQDSPHHVLAREVSMKARGSASVTLNLQSMLTGRKVTHRYGPDTIVEEAELIKKEVDFLAMDEDGQYVFIGKEEQGDAAVDDFPFYEVPEAVIKESDRKFLVAGMKVHLQLFEPPDDELKVVGVLLPPSAEYEVLSVDGNSSKIASIGLGARVKIPSHIKTGDRIVVSPVSGDYREKI
mmetsp:Transcript_65482/g.116523  ORF Transcript_65482/g.116523 Transcript_65482/m.116523 type:complete len:230 (-) Transcript_65482:833-1522(-)